MQSLKPERDARYGSPLIVFTAGAQPDFAPGSLSQPARSETGIFNQVLSWSPYVIGQTIMFSSCFFLSSSSSSSSFISSPNLSGRRLNVYHTSAHGVALVRIYNAGLKCAARGSLQIQDAKNRHIGTIAQFCQAISSQLRHVSTIGKKLVKQQYLLYMS